MSTIISEAKKRLKCETPRFFKKLRSYAVSLGVSAISVVVANNTLELHLPELVITVCKFLIAAAAAAGGMAQLTAVNPPKAQE